MKTSAWIEMIEDDQADEDLKIFFDLARTPHGTLDNVMRIHSLRPQTMIGHLTLYKSVLHNEDITSPLWFLEVVATFVSLLNKCHYSYTHHWKNAQALINHAPRSNEIIKALTTREMDSVFSKKEAALLRYGEKLTVNVGEMLKKDVDELRKLNCSDEETLEVNQVVAYFNYSNRLLNGLGVPLKGDQVGYYVSREA